MMKTRHNTPDRLILERQPWVLGIGLILFTLIFVGAGIAIALAGEWQGLFMALIGGAMGVVGFGAFVRRTQIIFDVPAGSVTIRRRNVFGFHEEAHPLTAVDRAEVQTSRSGDSNTHRPALVMWGDYDPTYIAIVPVYASGRGARRAVIEINSWLDARPEQARPGAQ